MLASLVAADRLRDIRAAASGRAQRHRAAKSAPPAQSGSRYSQDQRLDRPADRRRTSARFPNRCPKAEARSQYGNKSAVPAVLGETYQRAAGGATATSSAASPPGTATSSTATPRRRSKSTTCTLTAPRSKTLPLPSYARVTNLENRRAA